MATSAEYDRFTKWVATGSQSGIKTGRSQQYFLSGVQAAEWLAQPLRLTIPAMGNDATQSATGPAGGILPPVVLRNGYCTNRKGHCGREGRGDTLLNLTPEEASRICMDQCRAMCCRGPLILRLEPEEVAVFHREAVHLGTTADISPAADGGGDLLFLDHPGECCPMLDQATFACRIYEQRPRVCREFPRRPEPGCAISGWADD